MQGPGMLPVCSVKRWCEAGWCIMLVCHMAMHWQVTGRVITGILTKTLTSTLRTCRPVNTILTGGVTG